MSRRVDAPLAFQVTFEGPEGRYLLSFSPDDDGEGTIDVVIGDTAMKWIVDAVHLMDNGALHLGGMTTGSGSVWNNVYWFEIVVDHVPISIRYWGDRVIWREDKAIECRST